MPRLRFLRNMLGAVTPLFGSQMFNGMGFQFAGEFIALIKLSSNDDSQDCLLHS